MYFILCASGGMPLPISPLHWHPLELLLLICLQDSLGGNTRTVMIANVGPAGDTPGPHACVANVLHQSKHACT